MRLFPGGGPDPSEAPLNFAQGANDLICESHKALAFAPDASPAAPRETAPPLPVLSKLSTPHSFFNLKIEMRLA